MGHLIQVFEYEKLKADDKSYFSNEELGKKVINKLWKFNDSNNNIYFEAIRNGVRFKQYVGVIQIGKITIEILPKADKESFTQADKKTWHDALLKMLAVCKKIRVDSVSEASLKKRYHSLLELYFDLFLEEVNYLLQKGLIKKYRRNQGNLKALKGSLNFSKNLQQNLIHKERFYTAHQIYDYDHLINQILFKALNVLSSISNSSHMKDKVLRTLSRFPEVENKIITKSHFAELIANRKSIKYDGAIRIAKMILLNYSPDIKGGNEHMVALLFDMNKLWEEYILVRIRQATVTKENFKTFGQNSKPFWRSTAIRPDIVIEKDNSIFIIDTKWKNITSNKPSTNDLRQMYVYNEYWKSEKAILLYPFNKTEKPEFISFKGDSGHQSCAIGKINILKDGSLNTSVGEEILEWF